MADSQLWTPLSSMTATDIVNSAASQPRTPNNSLDKDAFLQLLIAQMKYQDPLNPMDDKEFIGQMAQFTSLEQMQNLNATFSKTHAYSMIGKTVYGYYQDPNSGQYNEVTGLVSAVTTKGSEIYLYVEGKDIPLSSVSVVGDDYFTASQLNSIFEGVTNARDMNFVGRHIQALIMDGEKVVDYVEGKVDYVKFNGGQAVLVVGEKEVFPAEVASVADSPLLLGKEIIAPVKVQVETDGTDKKEEVTEFKNVVVTGVEIINNKAYLRVASPGGADGVITPLDDKIPIDKINYAVEALQYVGRNISFSTYNGAVTSVTVRNGIPYFNVEGSESQLSYLDYRDRNK